jgi:predicted SAM-dependent methyltransferase
MRRLLRVFYKGKQHSCACCDYELGSFIHHSTGDLICPSCSSLERNRFLKLYLDENITQQESVLHFSPAKSLKGGFEKKFSNYIPTDFEGVLAQNRFDITNLPLDDNSMDLVICYHVFEHIPDVKKAISETFRVLQQGGVMLCQVPFGDHFYEDLNITDPEERLKHFGQEDHVRVYDLTTFMSQLEDVGYQVNIFGPTDHYSSTEVEKLGLRSTEIVVAATRV